MSANQTSLNAYSRLESLFQSCRPRSGLVKSPKPPLGRRQKACWSLAAALSSYALLTSLTLPLFASSARAEPAGDTAAPASGKRDPISCQTVRFSDVGWTDVTATTALAAQLLRSIGYSPTVTVLSVPVTFASIQNNDIDVFLGNWMPAQEADRARYLADGSVVVIGPNLAGAKYTLAVPAYTYEAGLRDFKDIQRFAPALKRFNPDFERSWVKDYWLSRTPYAQPVPPINHSQNIPAIRTPVKGLYFASMSQVYPWDRGTNYAVEIGRRTAKMVMEDAGTSERRA